MRWIVPTVGLALASCGAGVGRPRWFENCGGCGFPVEAPDGGWGAGSCSTQTVGATCDHAGESCSTSADPCSRGLICTNTDPAPTCGVRP